MRKLLIGMLGLLLFSPGNAAVLTINQAVDAAVKNNPSLKIAEKQLSIARLERKRAYELNQLDLNFQQGQINGVMVDYFFTVSQNFGSLWSLGPSRKLAEENAKVAEAQLRMLKWELSRETKLAYVRWAYAFQKLAVLKSQDSVTRILVNKVELMRKAGASSGIETGLVQQRLSAVEVAYKFTQAEYIQAAGQLSILTQDSSVFSSEPIWNGFMISNGDAVNPDLLCVWDAEISSNRAMSTLEKSKISPNLAAGVFTQQLERTPGYFGYHVSVGVPVWQAPQRARIEEVAIQSDILSADRDRELFRLQQELEALKKSREVLKQKASTATSDVRTKAMTTLAAGENDLTQVVVLLSTSFETELNQLNLKALEAETEVKIASLTNQL